MGRKRNEGERETAKIAKPAKKAKRANKDKSMRMAKEVKRGDNAKMGKKAAKKRRSGRGNSQRASKNNGHSNEHGGFYIFIKSAAVTFGAMAVMFLLVFGMLSADKYTAAANGQQGGLNVSQFDDERLEFNIMGNEVSVDLRPIKQGIDWIMGQERLLSPETRLSLLASKYEEDILDGWFKGMVGEKIK